MQFTEMESRMVCIICCKTFVNRPGETCTSAEHLQRFFTVLERHFGRNISSSNIKAIIKHVRDATNDDVTAAFGLACCIDCSRIIKCICDYFHEIKCLELKLLWRLHTLQNVMKSGGRVPARIRVLKDVCEKLDVVNEEQVGQFTATFDTLSDLRKALFRKGENF